MNRHKDLPAQIAPKLPERKNIGYMEGRKKKASIYVLEGIE